MSESEHVSTFIKRRMENLSDLVFGLALSIGSVILLAKLPQTPNDLVTGIALFGFSFLIIVLVWSKYTSVMDILPYEIGKTFLLNIVLLFCVALNPYLFYVLQQSQFSLLNFASSVYALDVGAMVLVLGGLTRLLLGEEKKHGAHKIHPDRLNRLRQMMILDVVTGVTFVASAMPFFWKAVPIGSFLRFDLWYVTVVAFLVFQHSFRKRK